MTLQPLTVGGLFSGIGGIELGLERAGMEIKWSCEIDPYCRRVLERHWPGVPIHGDVRTLGDLPRVDVLAGGFPCQPVSAAGKKLAQSDDRWLWPSFARIVRLVRPRYVFVENVPGLTLRGMGDVLGGLAAAGYDAEWDCIGAADAGAPHQRKRIWVVAYPHRQGSPHDPKVFPWTGGGGRGVAVGDRGGVGRDRAAADGGHADDPRRPVGRDRSPWRVEPGMGRMAHGIPHRVDRLRGLGNAVVPQVAEWVGRLIVDDYERMER